MQNSINGGLKRPYQDYSTNNNENNENSREVRQKTGSLDSIQELPVDTKLRVLSFLTQGERLRTNNNRQPNQRTVASTVIGRVDLLEANARARDSFKVLLFKDPTVADTRKLDLIGNAAESVEVRKAALEHAKQNILLVVHTYRQPNINFSPEEINVALQHADIGVVGAILENAHIPLSQDQIQGLWDRNEPYLRAMIVKSRGQEIELSNEDRHTYSLQGARLPLEDNIFARRGGMQEFTELEAQPDSPQIKAAYLTRRCGEYFILEQQANMVGRPLTEGQMARFESVEQLLPPTTEVDWYALLMSQLNEAFH
jgi:hypothetical protein